MVNRGCQVIVLDPPVVEAEYFVWKNRVGRVDRIEFFNMVADALAVTPAELAGLVAD